MDYNWRKKERLLSSVCVCIGLPIPLLAPVMLPVPRGHPDPVRPGPQRFPRRFPGWTPSPRERPRPGLLYVCAQTPTYICHVHGVFPAACWDIDVRPSLPIPSLTRFFPVRRKNQLVLHRRSRHERDLSWEGRGRGHGSGGYAGVGAGEKSDSQYRPHDLLSGSSLSKTSGHMLVYLHPLFFRVLPGGRIFLRYKWR